MREKLSILCLSTTDWDAPQFGSRQQVMQRLAARGHRVFYVEPPRSVQSVITDRPQITRYLSRTGRVRDEGRVQVYTPYPVLPLAYQRKVSRINAATMAVDLGRILGQKGIIPDVVWTYWPHTGPLIERLGAPISVYHCIDNFPATGYPFLSSPEIAAVEDEQVQAVSLVFVRTEGLRERHSRLNSETHCFPGGVDIDIFDPAREDLVPPDWLTALPRPRAVWVGTIDDRVDATLVRQVVSRLPEVQIVLVGPEKRHRLVGEALPAGANLHRQGAVTHGEVAGILAATDVGFLPYKLGSQTQDISPIKLHEALSMGIPVVATPLPYLRRWAGGAGREDLIHLAEGPDGFAAAVSEALAGDNDARRAGRRAAAREASWDDQVAAMDALVLAVRQKA